MTDDNEPSGSSEDRRSGDRRQESNRRKAGREGDDCRKEERRKKISKYNKRSPDSAEHKTVGDETKNPLPDHDYSQKQPSDGTKGTSPNGDGNR